VLLPARGNMARPCTIPRALYLLALAVSEAPALGAQASNASVLVAVGYGVDTVGAPNHEIFTLWRIYLSSRSDSTRAAGFWSRVERERWPLFDLLSGYVYQGSPNRFTVVHLAPAVGLDSTYLIRTLVTRVSDSGQTVRPLALYRVYATREGGRWVLGNALARVTRAWRHERIGRITFVFPPTHMLDRVRAERSSEFVDSLARAFALSPAPAIEYYFTDDLAETLAAAGLEFFPLGPDTAGGRANAFDHLVFVGSSTSGENYRHELAHIVLQPLVAQGKTAPLVMEGLMTWAGGSAGLDFKELMPGLQHYLDVHRDLTLEGILTDPPMREGTVDAGYDGLAVLCKMVYDAGGVAAIRSLASAGLEPRVVVNTAARLLHVPEAQLDARWRDQIAALSH